MAVLRVQQGLGTRNSSRIALPCERPTAVAQSNWQGLPVWVMQIECIGKPMQGAEVVDALPSSGQNLLTVIWLGPVQSKPDRSGHFPT